jgi:hypothetical protein
MAGKEVRRARQDVQENIFWGIGNIWTVTQAQRFYEEEDHIYR